MLFAGGVTHGLAGAGIGLVATPFIALLEPSLVPGPMLVPGFLISAGLALKFWRHAQLSIVAAGLAGRFPGGMFGAWVLALASARLYAWLFVGCVILSLIFSFAGPRVEPNMKTTFVAGLLSGLMSTLTAIGATPILLLMQHGEHRTVKGTLSVLFALGTLMSILSLWWVDRFSTADLSAGLLLSAPTCAGLALSPLVSARLEKAPIRPFLLGLVAFSIIPLLVRAIY
jgi:uncharacterized protein